MKKFFTSLLCISLLILTFLSGCSAGLGEEIDLEAPVLKITTPQRNAFTKKSITFEGTCTDNKKVEKVELSEIKTVNGVSTTQFLCNAEITGDTWNCTIELEEGERTIVCSAYDAFKNTSVNSFQQITLLVDETAPEGFAWYLDRGNEKFTYLQSKEFLSELDLNKASNVDYPQNVSFTVYGSIYDAMSVSEVILYVFDEDGNQILEVPKTAESSLYSPTFYITHDALVASSPSLASGIHYLQLKYYAIDNRGNEETRDLDWFIWYPESDYPNFDRSIVDKDTQTILAHVNSAVTIDIFDDDELAYVYTGLITEDQYNSLSGSTNEDKAKLLAASSESKFISLGMEKTSVSGAQISSVQAKTTGTPGAYYLAAFGCDATAKKIKNAVLLSTFVSDDNIPILFVESPSENTIPVIDNDSQSKFTISGYSLDTSNTESIKAAFIPYGAYETNAEKRTKAQEILAGDETVPGSVTNYENGIKVWCLSLTDDGKLTSGTTSWKKQNFKLSVDLLSDFAYKGQRENNVKFFEFQVIDDDNNIVYQDFKLEGDTTEPEITPNHEDMFVCDYTSGGLTLSFTASKTNGLGIDTESYKITRIVSTANGNIEEVLAEHSNTFTYTQEQLEEIVQTDSQPKFRFYAADLLGNKATAQRTVVLTTLPALDKVSSDAMNGTYKAGDVITLEASFTGPVKVTGTPRLSLKYSSDDSNPKYAVYSAGSGTDTLKFTYKVPSGASSAKLFCADNPVILNGGKIETTDINGGDAHLETLKAGNRLQDLKEIALDGVAPKINSLYISCEESAEGDFNAGKEIKAVIYADKNILVSGSPVLKLVASSKTFDCSFQGINGKQIIFTHKITASDSNGIVNYNLSNCFTDSDLEFITDTNGNNLVLNTEDVLSTSKIKIDTVSPAVPSMSFTPGTLTDNGTYNKSQTLKLSALEAGAEGFYSTDGGLSWSNYTSEGITLETGIYKLCAKQSDSAGNVSAVSAVVNVDINSAFPEVTDFTCAMADGTYPKGSVLTFKLSFASKVKAASQAYLTLFTNGSGKTAKVTEETEGSTSLTFTYTVGDGDSYNGLKVVSAALTGVTDLYGNTADSAAVNAVLAEKGSRPGIIIDAVSPVITAFTPKNSSGTPLIAQNGNVITLTFSEPVYKESGSLTLKRKGNWAIPPVMTETEFNSVYNELSADQKEVLMLTENGSAKLHSKTGLPVGPYRKITHGLKLSGSDYVPDTDTKYVLDFNLDLYSGTATVDGNTFSVADIRTAFENAGYHQQILDVTSSYVTVSDNIVTITFPKELVDGREWEFTMEEGCFRDKTGNQSGEAVYSFWSTKTAEPVVRVDRYSHGWGAVEPTETGTLTTITNYGTSSTTANSGAIIAPTGYARARIDCETPGAEIYYTLLQNLTYTDNVTATSTSTKAGTQVNATKTELESTFTGTKYSSFVIVGDGKLNTSRRDYIKAYAKKTNFADSTNGFEGIFKTLVLHYESGGKDIITIEGGTAAGGMPVISGFPLRDATLDRRYGKNAHTPTGTNNKKVWYWISYEIVSDFSEMGKVGNYTQNYYLTSYGLCTHIYNVAWY